MTNEDGSCLLCAEQSQVALLDESPLQYMCLFANKKVEVSNNSWLKILATHLISIREGLTEASAS